MSIDTIDAPEVDLPLADEPLVDPWVHAEPVTPPPAAPEPAADGLRPAVRAMVAELDGHFKGADPGSVAKAAEAMKAVSPNPKSWGSQGMAGEAVKAYRAKHGIEAKPAGKKDPARTAPPKPRRTAVVRPEPTPPVPPVVRAEPTPVVQPPVPPPAAPTVRTAPAGKTVRSWPVMVIALPAMVAIWGGWVGLGGLTGFGDINLLPGIVADGNWSTIDSAITLPVGVEAYAAFALRAWLSGRVPARAKTFARWSAIGSLAVGALGQVAYHLLVAAGVTAAPWWITTLVACLPVAVLGMAAALVHLMREEH